MREKSNRRAGERGTVRTLLAILLLVVLLIPAVQAATNLYLRHNNALEPMPNVKQSSDTITHDYATSSATYTNPANMTITPGSANVENSAALTEPKASHFTHLGSWISDPLAAQTVSGTITIPLSVYESDAVLDMNPRVTIYRWTSFDTKGENLLELTTSATEAPASWPSTPVIYFNAVSLGSVTFQSGDRIVIEIGSYDSNNKQSTYTQGIRFDGASGGAYGSNIQFSANLVFLQPPVAAFTANTVSGTAPLGVQFTDQSTNSPASWKWEYNSGSGWTQFSTAQSPSYIFTNPGTYSVRLTATNGAGSDEETKTEYIFVSSPGFPVADFSANPTFGTNFVTVQFTDLSTGAPTSWFWDFGDGDTTNNTQKNPLHTFLGAGYNYYYNVSLTATNSMGSNTKTKINFIYVNGASTRIRVVKYAADGTTILAQTTITNKTMEQTLPIMGDGITHYYHQGPIFEDDPDPLMQELIRWNPDEDTNTGPGSDKDYNAVKGTNLKDLCNLVGPIPVGSRIRVKATDGFSKYFAYRNVFEYSSREGPIVITWWRPDDGYVPYYSTGMRLIWYGDTTTNPWGAHIFGNWDWHEAANPYYWYWFNGEYPTTTGLSVQMVSEVAIFTRITIPAANFKTNLTSEYTELTTVTGDAPLTVKFIDWSTGDPSSWAWDFNNDGTTDSTLERPEFTYTIPGTYTVKLTATNSAGSDIETKTGCIIVTGTISPPVAGFSAMPLSGTAPLIVQFTDSSTNAPTSWKWAYKNATVGWTQFATTQNPSFAFPAGIYDINLTATNAGGSDDEIKTDFITVNTVPPPPVARFSAMPASGTAPLIVQFTDSSTNAPTSWKWAYKNASVGWTQFATTQNPLFTFPAGTYDINLTATNAGGRMMRSRPGTLPLPPPHRLSTSASAAASTTGIS